MPTKNQNPDVDDITPRPASMVAALRSIGYRLETAVADLVDNSIAKHAKNIWVEFSWRGDASTITIRDDGIGMSEEELIEAMRLGSHDPLWDRGSLDLGRFGLGLKTASFSQCKVFSVLTRKHHHDPVWRTWDIDYVIREGKWILRRDINPAAAADAQQLANQSSGTCVVWQTLDRLVGKVSIDDEIAHKAFLESASRVGNHLGMVFGEYLFGKDSVAIHVGRTKVERWDPFLATYDTQIAEVERFEVKGHCVSVRPHVLPHHSRMTKKEFERAAGPAGWNAQQGFYIYRNRRMLVSGGWMNLGLTRDEHMKLARIRIDIDSGSDFLWQLDIRKSKASPPVSLREDLRRIARLTRSRASEVYRHRGQKIISQGGDVGKKHDLWSLERIHDKVRYRIDREHPLVKSLIEEGQAGRSVNALLVLIEETIPAPTIYIGYAEKPSEQALPFETTKEATMRRILQDLFLALRESGNTVEQAQATLARMTPFDSHPQLLAELDEFDRQHENQARE
jgi:hypothetical protein